MFTPVFLFGCFSFNSLYFSLLSICSLHQFFFNFASIKKFQRVTKVRIESLVNFDVGQQGDFEKSICIHYPMVNFESLAAQIYIKYSKN